MEYLKRYIEMVKTKAKIREDTRPEGNTHTLYLQGLEEEIDEIKEELKENNHVYLEDELGDIIRDYMNMLHYLERAGLISSWENVFKRSMEKYTERVQGQVDGVLWKKVKKLQKEKLNVEHDSYYNTNTNLGKK